MKSLSPVDIEEHLDCFINWYQNGRKQNDIESVHRSDNLTILSDASIRGKFDFKMKGFGFTMQIAEMQNKPLLWSDQSAQAVLGNGGRW